MCHRASNRPHPQKSDGPLRQRRVGVQLRLVYLGQLNYIEKLVVCRKPVLTLRIVLRMRSNKKTLLIGKPLQTFQIHTIKPFIKQQYRLTFENRTTKNVEFKIQLPLSMLCLKPRLVRKSALIIQGPLTNIV